MHTASANTAQVSSTCRSAAPAHATLFCRGKSTTARNDIRRIDFGLRKVLSATGRLLCSRILEASHLYGVVSLQMHDKCKARFGSAMRARPGQPWHYATNAKCSVTIQTMTVIIMCGLVLKTNRAFSSCSHTQNVACAPVYKQLDLPQNGYGCLET